MGKLSVPGEFWPDRNRSAEAHARLRKERTMLHWNSALISVATLWVAGTSFGQDTSIRPFRVNVPDEALADLRRRIVATHWPDKETVADQSQGVQLATMQKLAHYWATDYDWPCRRLRN
jgi:hypothetical protein